MKKLFVLFVALALVGFTVPAMAGEWSFYGNARMSTFITDFDDDAGDDNVLNWNQQGNARIGARVKASDVISGRFEYGNGPNLRILQGTWNFGGGKLTVGHGWTPINLFPSSQVHDGDWGLLDTGAVFGGRHPRIQLGFGGLTIALVEPNSGRLAGDTDGDVDANIPKFEIKYGFKTDSFGITAVAGYNTYEVNDSTAAGDYEVDSYVVGVMASFNFGPAGFKATVGTGQNMAQYGSLQQDSTATLVGSTVEDGNTLFYSGVIFFKASDILSFEAGYGAQINESDVAGAEDDEMSTYYVQAKISPVAGFFIVPEVGVYDYQDDAAGNSEGTATYFGAKWQISF